MDLFLKGLRVGFLLLIAIIFIITAFQMAQFWLAVAYYPFVSTIVTGLTHLAILGVLVWLFALLYRHKV